MFEIIKDPKTGKFHKIDSAKGKQVIRKYRKYAQKGGFLGKASKKFLDKNPKMRGKAKDAAKKFFSMFGKKKKKKTEPAGSTTETTSNKMKKNLGQMFTNKINKTKSSLTKIKTGLKDEKDKVKSSLTKMKTGLKESYLDGKDKVIINSIKQKIKSKEEKPYFKKSRKVDITYTLKLNKLNHNLIPLVAVSEIREIVLKNKDIFEYENENESNSLVIKLFSFEINQDHPKKNIFNKKINEIKKIIKESFKVNLNTKHLIHKSKSGILLSKSNTFTKIFHICNDRTSTKNVKEHNIKHFKFRIINNIMTQILNHPIVNLKENNRSVFKVDDINFITFNILDPWQLINLFDIWNEENPELSIYHNNKELFRKLQGKEDDQKIKILEKEIKDNANVIFDSEEEKKMERKMVMPWSDIQLIEGDKSHELKMFLHKSVNGSSKEVIIN
jgi:hypothetical protein